jgi:outer membrane protein assembly factor BamB
VCVRVTARSWAPVIWLRSPWGVSPVLGLLLFPIGAAAQGADPASPFPLVSAWTLNAGAAPSTPLATDGRAAYFGTRDGQLLAVSVHDGRLRWSVPLATEIAPVADGERVFVSTAGAIEARAAGTGEIVWQAPLPAAPAAPAATRAGWLLVPLDTGDLLALNAASGALVWRRNVGALLSVSPEILGERVYGATADGRVLALDIRDGSPVWDRKLGGRIGGLRVTEDRIYAGSHDNFLYVLASDTGRQAWRWRTGGTVIGVPALDERHIYIVSLDNLMRALDLRGGSQRWRTSLAFRPITGPLRLGQTLIAAGRSPELRGYAAATGRAVGHQPLGNELAVPPLVVAGPLPPQDWLIVLFSDGRLEALARRLAPDLAPLERLPGVPLGPTDGWPAPPDRAAEKPAPPEPR